MEGRKSSLATGWMLLPHTISAAAFLGSFAIIGMAGADRTDADLMLGLTGFAASAFALITTLATLILHPWGRASARNWIGLAAHIAATLAVLVLANAWLGANAA